MTRLTRTRWSRMAAATVVGSLLLAGCAGGTESSGDKTAQDGPAVRVGLVGEQGDGGEPVRGGTLSYATYAPVSTLDPLVTYATGSTGGTELAAVYDLLVRYDAQTDKYEPQLAKAVDVSEDQKTWTLTLRDGVTFSDGTPLNGQAVLWSIQRYLDKRGLNSQLFKTGVSKMESPTPSTVVFTLTEAWPEFWAMLSSGPGVIVAPSSMQSGKFTPIGAGPYTVERLSPQNELVLKANPGYWGGEPNISTLRFVNIAGEQAKVDAFKSGGVQMIYLRNPEATEQITAMNAPAFVDTGALGNVGVINHRPGRPGADVRIRQAMAYAVNPEAIDQRVYAGKGMPGADLFPEWSRWHTDVRGLGYDPEKAKQLLEEAKKDGYDGRLTYAGFMEPKAQAQALAVQAMLQAVGFTVEISYANNVTELTKRIYVDNDYDISRGSFSLWEAAPQIRLASTLASDSDTNSMGYKNAAMDAALVKVKSASTDADKRTAIAEIQKLMNETVPFLTWGTQAALIPWQTSVHGLKPSLDGIILFDKAWMK
ncbi:ABC transporter substrate-binding protein [Rhodococcus sp. X156]|uniref:ABC transporter substrate-binding protein n=1 Tax=Rhodococcus sp. X156 TaxID=2499145 RepID=UPI000FD99F41|nr:ABC transporter substrate-binding protein [Rhodococcus sp. X156]